MRKGFLEFVKVLREYEDVVCKIEATIMGLDENTYW